MSSTLPQQPLQEKTKDEKKLAELQESFGKQYAQPQAQQQAPQQILEQQKLQKLLGQQINIKHPQYDFGHDVTCLVNFSGPSIYKNCARHIEEHLQTHFPGIQVLTSRLPEKENMIDIRLRKGWAGDDFLHYVENIEEHELEKRMEQEISQIELKLVQELINAGFEFHFEQAPQAQQPKAQKQFHVPLGRPMNITHPKLDIGLDINCFVNYSGPMVYKYSANQIADHLKLHFPGMQVIASRLPEAENMIDVRLRKGVSGGDEFIHYIENIQEKDLESRLEEEIPKIVHKINAELVNLGFQLNFNLGQEKDLGQQPVTEEKIKIQE